jgi:hypothetical protein
MSIGIAGLSPLLTTVCDPGHGFRLGDEHSLLDIAGGFCPTVVRGIDDAVTLLLLNPLEE